MKHTESAYDQVSGSKRYGLTGTTCRSRGGRAAGPCHVEATRAAVPGLTPPAPLINAAGQRLKGTVEVMEELASKAKAYEKSQTPAPEPPGLLE